MLAEALRTLYGYNRWATGRLLDAAAGLTSEQLLAPGNAGRGSIRDTLVHMLSTQRGWLSWWDGSLPPFEAYNSRLESADFPDIASVRVAWEALEWQTQTFVTGLDDDAVAAIYAQKLPNGATWQMTLWTMMLHVANHGTQHRSEVAAMMTGFDNSPGDLDLLFYVGSE